MAGFGDEVFDGFGAAAPGGGFGGGALCFEDFGAGDVVGELVEDSLGDFGNEVDEGGGGFVVAGDDVGIFFDEGDAFGVGEGDGDGGGGTWPSIWSRTTSVRVTMPWPSRAEAGRASGKNDIQKARVSAEG